MSVPSTQRTSLGEAAYLKLRSDIVSCRLAPGQRLTERSLADSTGFGISPIRDALTRLDHDGLVRTLPRKGYQVTPLTLKAVDDLFTVWQILGTEIARLGVREANTDQRQRAVALLTEMSETWGTDTSGDLDVRRRDLKLAGEFIWVLCEAVDNEYITGIYERLHHGIERAWTLVSEAHAALPGFGADEEWIAIINRRDGDAAAARIQATTAEAHARILRILSRWPSVVSSEISPLRS